MFGLLGLCGELMIKNTVKSFLHASYGFLGGPFPKSGLRVLMYHSIGEFVSLDPNKLFSVPTELFKTHMEYLKSRDDIRFIIPGDKPSQNKLNILVTFDDGYKNNLTIAAPVLEKLEIPFLVFVASRLLGKKDMLSSDELKKLDENRFCTIGSHGASHNPLDKMDFKDASLEIMECKKTIEDIIGHEVLDFSFPHGSHNDKLDLEVKKTGFKRIYSSYYDINIGDENILGRTEINTFDNLGVFKDKIDGRLDWRKFITT